MADALVTHQNEIIKANEEDLRRGKESGLRTALLDRLALNEERIAAMAEGLPANRRSARSDRRNVGDA